MGRFADTGIELNEYESYLRLEELLSLQSPTGVDQAAAETLFITVHQACELNFHALIATVNVLIGEMDADDYSAAIGRVKIINALIESVVAQTRTLNQLSTPDFFEFRPLLGSASGFQSVQFQILQVLLSGADEQRLAQLTRAGAGINDEVHRVAASGRSVVDSLDRCRRRSTTHSWSEILSTSAAGVQTHPGLRALASALIDTDTLWFEWKAMHFNLVGRHLGFGTTGTGGTENSFLLKSLAARLFPTLWEPRT
ncbi:tryptophan 2,3-dioxygenase family protein [Gordonia sp. VNK21]|uniref:tryptophan 2,3-dioxygenase family protein n=1 Tax=Gordonia sp. VNK21 TaxID=3382483 RepID=UPI0038D37DB9